MRSLLCLAALVLLASPAAPVAPDALPALALGFSREAHAAAVTKGNLATADAWVAKYEGDKNGANLQKKLETEHAAFLKDGLLEVAK